MSKDLTDNGVTKCCQIDYIYHKKIYNLWHLFNIKMQLLAGAIETIANVLCKIELNKV